MKLPLAFLALTLLVCFAATAQISFTAQTRVDAYNGNFRYGVNQGWYDASWDDFSTSNIAAGNPALNIPGISATTLRPMVFEQFTTQWGLNILTQRFQHYSGLGLGEHTLFVDLPVAAAHADNSFYQGCTESPSKLYANMYEPIWDGGANGTPVNENNHYALYIYQLAQTYKNHVRFWEIINEPDQDWGMVGWKDAGFTDSWWHNAPTACQLKNIYVPIYRYIRLLRISYEVIKFVDETAYITPGGIGYASFLDCLLRYTDNPTDGSVNAQYPVTGGAYFDVVSFHAYPHLNMGSSNRHSDRANEVYTNSIASFESVLNNRGYNGSTYPKKHLICTENNAPRKIIGGNFGGIEAQRNYIIKSFVASQKKGLLQTQLYSLGDMQPYNTATDPFNVMGLYANLHNIGPLWNSGQYLQQMTDGGIAFKTTSQKLTGYRYSSALTAALNLPANIDGAAFTNSASDIFYVLWAKTSTDNSETASAIFSIPVAANPTDQLYKYEWNASVTGLSANISKSNIALTGSPLFLKNNYSILAMPNDSTGPLGENVFKYSFYPNPAREKLNLNLSVKKYSEVFVELYDAGGKFAGTILSKRFIGTGSHDLPLALPANISSGVYFCRIHVNEKLLTVKLLVAK
ncbi:MAG: T9SS type A sorting domain-containing protein [Ferruginibacter sp.]